MSPPRIPCVLLLLALVARAAGAQGPEALPAAASEEHVWFATELRTDEDGRRVRLFHHAPAMGGAFYRTPIALPRLPEAVAAYDARAWLVFRRQVDRVWRREVFSVGTRLNAATGLFFYEPPNGLNLLDPLPGLGRLAGFVGTARGPAALLLPESWREAGVEAGPDAIAAEPALDEPTLLVHDGDAWLRRSLPEDLAPHRPVGLTIDPRTERPMVLLRDPVDDSYLGLVPEDDGGWRRVPLPKLPSPSTRFTRSLEQLIQIGREGEDGLVPLVLVRPGWIDPALPGLATPVARFEPEAEAWNVVGLREGLVVLERLEGATLRLRTIDPLTGVVAPGVVMSAQPLSTGARVFMPLMFVVLATALLVAVLMRPAGEATPTALPEGVVPATLTQRLLALAVDLLPGAIVALLATRADPAELLRVPVAAMAFADSAALFLMLGVTLVYATIFEAVSGRTPGKRLVGIAVVRTDGSRPGFGAAAARNLLKVVTLLFPPLAIFVLLNPFRQHLGDVAGRTVVVTKAPPAPPAE